MSYDLYLKPRSGSFSKTEFLDFFFKQPSYRLKSWQALYTNESTGVYFLFELNAGPHEADDPTAEYPLVFQLNFFRPSFFAREAEPEVRRIVQALDMVVFDPQIDGMGTGEYDTARFHAGWTCGNEAGYSTILRDTKDRSSIHSMPARKLEQAWRWNLGRQALQAELGEGVFVPTILFVQESGGVVTAVVWTDGIPTAFPQEVDRVIVHRSRFAPKRLLFLRQNILSFVPWDDLRPLVERHARGHKGVLVGDYTEPKAEIVSYLQSLPPRSDSMTGVPADSVHEAELVARHLG